LVGQNDVTVSACTTTKTVTIGSSSVAGNYTNAAFIHANAAYDYANTLVLNSADTFARDTANSGFIHANSAFDKANTSIVLNDVTLHLGDTANISRIRALITTITNMVVRNGADTAWAFGGYGDGINDTYFMQVKFWGGNDNHHGFKYLDTKDNTGKITS
jgi:hypothetical protein